MKTQSKWFLSAVSAFIVAVVLTALSSFGTLKTNAKSQKGNVFVSSITKIENVK